MTPYKYIVWILALGIFAPLPMVFMANVVIDPYGIWGSNGIEGLNTRKPLYVQFERIYKAYAVRRLKPQGIVLGSSRAARGIDPDHPAWPTDNNYNLALKAMALEEAESYLNHSIQVANLKVVVFGLDFFTFNAHWKTHEQFDREILANETSDWGWMVEALRLSTSSGTLRDSWTSFRMQNSPEARLAPLKNGSANDDLMRKNIFEWGGQRAAFENSEWVYLNDLYNIDGKEYVFADETTDAFDKFRGILADCYKNDIRLILFVSPTHARHLEMIAYAGLWGKFEEWKRQLVAANEAVAIQYSKVSFALYDFSGYNAWSSEPLPVEEGTEAQMKYYWESSHYTRELGNVVLDRVFSGTERGDGFGRKLSSESVEGVLQSIREERNWYAQTFPSEVEAFEAAMRKRREESFSDGPPL